MTYRIAVSHPWIEMIRKFCGTVSAGSFEFPEPILLTSYDGGVWIKALRLTISGDLEVLTIADEWIKYNSHPMSVYDHVRVYLRLTVC